ncbi:uncharacterized protein BDV14DRAFT_86790 [Aspergillus stella-maris]|uniref:uncharacterized protein n=1 Tax=Aspergillus stella-maris TaxID=1810926 RepID=UPI003CCDD115
MCRQHMNIDRCISMWVSFGATLLFSQAGLSFGVTEPTCSIFIERMYASMTCLCGITDNLIPLVFGFCYMIPVGFTFSGRPSVLQYIIHFHVHIFLLTHKPIHILNPPR